MNYEDHSALSHEDMIRRQMMQHMQALRELALQIPNADHLREDLKQLHYKIQYWGL